MKQVVTVLVLCWLLFTLTSIDNQEEEVVVDPAVELAREVVAKVEGEALARIKGEEYSIQR